MKQVSIRLLTQYSIEGDQTIFRIDAYDGKTQFYISLPMDTSKPALPMPPNLPGASGSVDFEKMIVSIRSFADRLEKLEP